MKKRKVVIVTLLCGLVLGNLTEVGISSVDLVYAENLHDEVISNRIILKRKYIDHDGLVEEYKVQGKIGDKIKISDFINSYYLDNVHIVDRYGKEINEIEITGKNGFVQVIYTIEKKLETAKYEFEFYDIGSNEIINLNNKYVVEDQVMSYVTLDESILPDGYEYVARSKYDTSISVQLPENERTVKVDIQKKKLNNKVQFVDDYGNIVDEKDVRGDLNEKRPVEDTTDYEIIGEKFVTVQKNGSIITKRVKNKRLHKTIKFIKNGKEKSFQDLPRKYNVGSYIPKLDIKVPKDYVLKNPNEQYQVQDNGNQYIDIAIEGKNVMNKVNFVDQYGKIIDQRDLEGKFGEHLNVDSNLIEGYKIFDSNYIFKDEDTVHEIRIYKIIENNVSFVDIYGNQVGSSIKVKGVSRQHVSLIPPKGYIFPDNVNNFVTISDADINQKVIVVKSQTQLPTPDNGSNSGSTSSNTGSSKPTPGTGNNSNVIPPTTGDTNETEFKSVVSTHSHMAQIPLFDSNGKQSNRSLSSTTDWQVDRKKTIKGETYYRVSSNEWVKAEHVFEYSSINEVITTQDKVTPLYDSRGKQSVSRSLAGNTSWQTDKSTVINGQKYYRVSTTEWLSATDIK